MNTLVTCSFFGPDSDAPLLVDERARPPAQGDQLVVGEHGPRRVTAVQRDSAIAARLYVTGRLDQKPAPPVEGARSVVDAAGDDPEAGLTESERKINRLLRK